MRVYIKNFGDILTSREAGKETLLAYTPTLNALSEKISVHSTNALDDDRLNSVIQMLNKEGIETFIEKYNRASILK